MYRELKILHLVIHRSDILDYEQMYRHLSKHYKKYSNVKTLFIEYSMNLERPFVFEDDKLKIRGTESLVPGLLWKTIDSILVMLTEDHHYSYVVRSNVSTLVNFDRVFLLLRNTSNVKYLAGNLMNLQWLDIASGIVDKKWFGTLFAQGTFICMSIGFVERLIALRHKLWTNIIDDVSIGIFYRENFANPIIHHLAKNEFITVSDILLDDIKLNEIENSGNPIVWRNKSSSRKIDVLNIEKIAQFVN